MQITTNISNQNLIISLSGRLDTITSPLLEEEVNRNSFDEIETVTLNMRELEYISSAGLRVILMLYKKLTNFIATSDPRLIFVYGEYDPWTSVGITKLDGKKNMFVAIQPKGSHRARINTLPDSLRDKVIQTIKLWLEN